MIDGYPGVAGPIVMLGVCLGLKVAERCAWWRYKSPSGQMPGHWRLTVSGETLVLRKAFVWCSIRGPFVGCCWGSAANYRRTALIWTKDT